MALRLLQVYLPHADQEQVRRALLECPVQEVWHGEVSEQQVMIALLLTSEQAETVLDLLDERFSISKVDGYRVVLLPVEATVPRLDPAPAAEAETDPGGQQPRPGRRSARLSREELYADVSDLVDLSANYLVQVVLSATVAAVGLMANNVAVLIGAMVIAPLLGPNVGLTLATTLADGQLARRAVRTGAAGMLTALAFSVALGLLLPVHPGIPEVATRTAVGPAEVVLALAAGVSGALAVTTGTPASLIGVMVAVALMPPLVAFGMLLGAGFWQEATGALLLLAANLVCVNLAGVATFLAQGVRPGSWLEAGRARRASRLAMLIWGALLAALLAVVLVASRQ